MAKWMYTIDLIRIIVLGCFWIESMWRTSSMLFNVLSWYMVMVNVLVNMLFVNNLNVLKACLSKINEFLESLKKTLINDEPHLLRRVYHTQKNPVLLMELKACRRQHLEISKIIEIFNEAFGFENIVTVAITLVGVTFNISDYLEVNTNDVKAFAIDRIVYLTYISLHLVLIIVTCEKLKNEAKTIGINIHRILVVTSNRQLTTQLEFFSIQALQQNHTILAKGLVIDATLLTKLIGSITTYVLILVQFIIVKHC
ncbi:PREDICTED: uncharacterized protein LOC107189548 [Dufourea novaeangliae]|uniref:uncharacterized protein LOC107189548 n=1 Tax=Dufourea novaeangliae TaxID=178035 RepID=UPI0007678CB2|nr:PREDICTED: uncharacterized protein LOC107189548 [Dufourea novaeangliae]